MLNAKQVAELLGLSSTKIYELARSGALPSYRFDDAVRFDPVDVEAYKQACRVKPPPVLGTLTVASTSLRADPVSNLRAFFRAAGVTPREDPRAASAKKKRRGKAAPCTHKAPGG